MRFLVLITFLLIRQIHAQAINPDLVVWTTINNWIDLRACVQYCLNGGGDGYAAIQQYVGCTTNACLCRADTLGAGVVSLADHAISACSDFQDQSTATSILLSYCSAKGYTSIISPTILSSGACTPTTTATVTAYVTSYVTVRSGARPSSSPPFSSAMTALLTIILLHHFAIF